MIPASRKIFSRIYQSLIFLDTVYFIRYEVSLALTFQTRSFQAFYLEIQISIGIVLVLRRDNNQDFSCLSHKFPNNQTVPIHVYKVPLTIVQLVSVGQPFNIKAFGTLTRSRHALAFVSSCPETLTSVEFF